MVNASLQTGTSAVPILRLHELSFRFERRSMFTKLNLELGTGIHWLRGANGAGKTTLLKLLGGALEPQSGQMRFAELDRQADPLAWRAACFLCQADTPQLAWLSVQELLDLYLDLYLAEREAQREAVQMRLQSHLQAFNMLDSLAQYVTHLSLGQNKKLHLALALSLPVNLLLLDEPLNALDTSSIAYLRQELVQPARLASTCLLLTSHVAPNLPLTSELEIDKL